MHRFPSDSFNEFFCFWNGYLDRHIEYIDIDILALLRYVKNHFSFVIIFYIIIVNITIILFFSTVPVIGGKFSEWIGAACMVSPLPPLIHWLLWVSRRVDIIFIFICYLIIIIIINFFLSFFFCKLFLVDHHWGVDVPFHIYHMTYFNYDAKEARDVGLSCRCHQSNSQIISSV